MTFEENGDRVKKFLVLKFFPRPSLAAPLKRKFVKNGEERLKLFCTNEMRSHQCHQCHQLD